MAQEHPWRERLFPEQPDDEDKTEEEATRDEAAASGEAGKESEGAVSVSLMEINKPM